jgi:hypothetical protein
VRCDVSLNVLGAPAMNDTILSACGEEHAVVVCDGDTVHRMLMLVERRDEATLWSKLLRGTSLLAQSVFAGEPGVAGIDRH